MKSDKEKYIGSCFYAMRYTVGVGSQISATEEKSDESYDSVSGGRE